MLGLNKQYVIKKDIMFRVPVSYLTLGALNMKNEFSFEGELSNILIGTSWSEMTNNELNKEDNDIKKVNNCQELLHNIQNNLNNIKEDIHSLQDIKKITSWRQDYKLILIYLIHKLNILLMKKQNLKKLLKRYEGIISFQS